ncbi:MAG: fibronectin type III domain-containing protein [Akkermansiaceae bacterium]|nr:fibronectin type III domain-containing protein [Akkermansiaceae bacterium]
MKQLLLTALFPALLHAAAPEEYTLTNITGWTPAQLAALPHFDRYVPVKPTAASTDFTPVCSNGIGLVTGNRGTLGSYVVSATQTNIEPWGTYYWSYWIWDGRDNHFYSGNVKQSAVRAANVLGQVMGYSTIAGSGSSSLDYDSHLYLRDTTTGEHLDLTPTAHRADPRDMNDHGEITGNWSETSASHPFRRASGGTFTDFVFDYPYSHYIAPSVINNHGHVAGMITIWETPRIHHPFFSESGSAVVTLPYPSQASPDTGSIADINDHDILVGEAHQSTNTTETSAVRWWQDGNTWVAEDLNELLVDNFDFILDRAIAVNDAGHIIATGHADGGADNTFNTHTFLLTPVTFPAPTTTALQPSNIGATSADLRVKINAANLTTSSTLEYGTSTSFGSTVSLPASSGTSPQLALATVAGLNPNTTYHFRATSTNASGATTSNSYSFTTPWNWASWSTTTLGSSDPEADTNQNGLPDLIDYATGTTAHPTLATTSTQAKLTFRRSLIADGVTIIVQVSDDLVHWQDGSTYSLGSGSSSNATTTELSRTPDGTDGEMVTVGTDLGDHTFMRIKVTAP